MAIVNVAWVVAAAAVCLAGSCTAQRAAPPPDEVVMPPLPVVTQAPLPALPQVPVTPTAPVVAEVPEPGAPPSGTTQAQRMKLAEHTIGINMAFYEAQRAGAQAADSVNLFPNVWEWKRPGYENICADFLETLTPEEALQADLQEYPGFFEAGNAVLVTAPTAFVTAQVAIGALQYLPQLAGMKSSNALGDPAGCLTGGFAAVNLQQLLLRQLRYMAATLSSAVVVTTEDNSNFVMLVGVADSSAFGSTPYPSWLTPPEYEEKCYFADLEHPASDIAAQAAAGLAMAAKALGTHGTAADKVRAEEYGKKAARAYDYAMLMYVLHGSDAVCLRSPAVDNCIGSGCTTVQPNGDPVRPVCMLYQNQKDAPEFLFTAAAALYALTGDAAYRADADLMWPELSANYQVFLYNWNNVVMQGVVILSMASDVPGAQRSRDFYRGFLRKGVGMWSDCSNNGESVFNNKVFCERTADGSAYPLDFPWGNLGTTMNAMCAAGTLQALGADAGTLQERKDAACFMQRQLGYIYNHKCTTRGSSCDTHGPDGFSYMVGMGANYPTRLHSRDVAYPNFSSSVEEDTATLCGAIVSGPYAAPRNGPVEEGTDLYENDRRRWQASETAIDYTSSLVCTMMAYANTPDSLLEGCPARTAFTGRDPV